jgi:hypothetical protein
MITRRNFIHAIGLASAAAVTFNLSGTAFGQKTTETGYFSIPAESLTDPVLSFKSEHFIPFINTDFEIRHENLRRTEVLRLLNVKELERKANQEEGFQGESFSLMFFSPRGKKLDSEQFDFTHFSLGAFKLTISPVSAEPNRYEAVINHLQR